MHKDQSMKSKKQGKRPILLLVNIHTVYVVFRA